MKESKATRQTAGRTGAKQRGWMAGWLAGWLARLGEITIAPRRIYTST